MLDCGDLPRPSLGKTRREYIAEKSYGTDSRSPDFTSEEVIGGGLLKIVKRVMLDFGGREAPFVLKKITFPKFVKPENYRRYYNFWKRLKEADIPTLPTMRIEKTDGVESGILETDLTENGKNFVFGSHDVDWKDGLRKSPQYRDLSENDLYGAKIPISNWSECKKSVAQIAARAAQNGIFLEFDAYSLVATPNEDGETYTGWIVVTDLDESFYPRKLDKTIPLSQHNTRHYKTFLEACEEFNITTR